MKIYLGAMKKNNMRRGKLMEVGSGEIGQDLTIVESQSKIIIISCLPSYYMFSFSYGTVKSSGSFVGQLLKKSSPLSNIIKDAHTTTLEHRQCMGLFHT